jgi:hypothetical protein
MKEVGPKRQQEGEYVASGSTKPIESLKFQ